MKQKRDEERRRWTKKMKKERDEETRRWIGKDMVEGKGTLGYKKKILLYNN